MFPPISKNEERKEETEGAEERGVKKETSSEGRESRREERDTKEKESFFVSNPKGRIGVREREVSKNWNLCRLEVCVLIYLALSYGKTELKK